MTPQLYRFRLTDTWTNQGQGLFCNKLYRVWGNYFLLQDGVDLSEVMNDTIDIEEVEKQPDIDDFKQSYDLIVSAYFSA